MKWVYKNTILINLETVHSIFIDKADEKPMIYFQMDRFNDNKDTILYFKSGEESKRQLERIKTFLTMKDQEMLEIK